MMNKKDSRGCCKNNLTNFMLNSKEEEKAMEKIKKLLEGMYTKTELINKLEINYKLLNNKGKLPIPQAPGSSKYDLHANIEKEIIIKPLKTVSIKTGIAFDFSSMNSDTSQIECQIRDRNSLGKQGIIIRNNPCIIDSNFQGEIKVLLLNTSTENYIIENNDKIAELVFIAIIKPTFNKVNDFKNITKMS